jgi:hypothetical protein
MSGFPTDPADWSEEDMVRYFEERELAQSEVITDSMNRRLGIRVRGKGARGAIFSDDADYDPLRW